MTDPKPRRHHQSRRSVRLLPVLTGLALAASCSGGGSARPGTTSPTPTTAASVTTAVTSPTASPTPSSARPSSTRPSTSTGPDAGCPTLPPPKVASPLRALPCTSLAILARQAKTLGLRAKANKPTPVAGLSVQLFDRLQTLPVSKDPLIAVYHLDNGAPYQVVCDAPAARLLDPVLKVCANVGPATRTDRARVQAWSLKAQTTIKAKPSSILKLTSSNLLFVACADADYPPPGGGVLYQMSLYVQVGAGEFSSNQCKS